MSQSYSFKRRDICVLLGPRTDAAVQSLTDPANDLLHARLPCPAPGHWAVQLQECHEDHLHLPHAGVGPHQLDHVWFTGLRDVFRPQLPGPLTHRLIHPVRRKKASKRNRQSTAGDVYVVGGEEGWDPANPGLSMPLVPLAALPFLWGGVFEGYQQQDDPASVPLLTPHTGSGINPSPLWVVHGRPAFSRACAAVHGCSEWAIVLLLPAGPVPDPDEYSVPEVVRMSNVPHDPHVAVTSLRDGGAVEQGSVVVYTSPPAPQRFGYLLKLHLFHLWFNNNLSSLILSAICFYIDIATFPIDKHWCSGPTVLFLCFLLHRHCYSTFNALIALRARTAIAIGAFWLKSHE